MNVMNAVSDDLAFVATDFEPLALPDFPSELKLDFLGLDASPTAVDDSSGHPQAQARQHSAAPPESVPTDIEPLALPDLPAEFKLDFLGLNTSSTASGDHTKWALADEEQRARNRLVVKRCYYKKINTLNELRTQVESIEAEYNALLDTKHAAAASPTPAPSQTETDVDIDADASRLQGLHAAYTNLLLVKRAMQRENTELRRVEAQYHAMEKQMGQLYGAETRAITQAIQAHAHKRQHAPVNVRPLSIADCLAIAGAAYQEIVKFRQSRTLQSTGANVFGWHDRYTTERNELMFSLDKTFYGHSAADISARVWHVLSTPETLEKTYSSTVDVSFRLVQRVSDDAMVFYHTLERGSADMRIHSLVLAMRVELIGGGCLILFRGLDPERYLISDADTGTRDRRGRTKIEPQKEKIWMGTFSWCTFDAAGEFGEHCYNDYGGIVQGTRLADTSWWALETLMIALRCEAQVVGPQVVLTSE